MPEFISAGIEKIRMRMLKRNPDIQIILDYVEGRISANAFKEQFEKNKKLQNLLQMPIDRKYEYLKRYDFQLYNYFRREYFFPKEQLG